MLAGVTTEAELACAIEHQFEPVVHCVEQLELLEAARSGAVTVWLKFDTGMNRLGFPPQDADQIISRLRATRAVDELQPDDAPRERRRT